MTVYLNGLATAVPPHELSQGLVLEAARQSLWSRDSQFERMSGCFETSGVKRRYSMAPIEWFREDKTWPQRNSVYLEGSKSLFIRAATKVLEDAALTAADIDTIVTVSSTGIATPTLEALAWKDMGFRSDVHRIPLFGLGCAGGVTGMAIARAQAEAQPGTNVLMIALEACTLCFRARKFDKADIIATVLFGDGAAAACLSTDRSGSSLPSIVLGRGEEEIWADTLGIMGWTVEETGLGVIFDRSIPDFALDHLADATNKALNRAGLARGDIDRFVCHPGGLKVVQAIESAFGLASGSLDAERRVLEDFGNMSAPTVLFVLRRLIDRQLSGQMMLSALGPGFTASFLPLKIGSTDV